MTCDEYLELLSTRLDGALTRDEELAMEDHQAGCPDCRAAGAQLAALRSGFGELEDIPAPEGFTQSVMDRIRTAETPKVIPLFKRPQFRALAGLAACLVVVVGLYGAARQSPKAVGSADGDDFDLMVRSFNTDAVEDFADASACESLSGDENSPMADAAPVVPELTDAPQIASYAAPTPEDNEITEGMEKAASSPTADGIDGDWAYAEITLTLDRMPEGGWELIPPDTFVSPVGLTVSVELLEQLEQLALEQGIGMSRVSGPEINDHCLIIILDEER